MTKRKTPQLPHKIKQWRGNNNESFINNGAYGRVYKISPTTVIKKIPQTKDVNCYAGEVIALAFKHDALGKILNVMFDLEFINITMEFAGDILLEDILKNSDLVHIASLMRIAFDLTRGLIYMHRLDHVHRDVNPNNIIWDSARGQARLVDFGSTRPVDTWAMISGSRRYQPPEITFSQHDYHKVNISLDCWSCGVIFLDMHAKSQNIKNATI